VSAPVVGLTSYVERARFSVWDMTTTLLPHAYVEQVVRAGGRPVVLPPAGAPAALLPRLDALVVIGGNDVNPSAYGAPPHPLTELPQDFRDDAELSLVRAALEEGVPFLGICRGMQVLNVALGGTLHQHVPDVVGHERHCAGSGRYARLPVTVARASRLGRALGEETVTVSHYHHQGGDRMGAGLTATAWAQGWPRPPGRRTA
jgi:putative glutamine amidotransferase